MVPSYLQVSLAGLAKEQDRLSKHFGSALTPAGAIEAFQDQARKNVAMFEQAMTSAMGMFTFGQGQGGYPSATTQPPNATSAQAPKPSRPEVVRTDAARPEPGKPATTDAGRKDDLTEIKAQMAAMQATIEKLSHRGS
jgi:polyhydroxyalkanoate synthesis regulator protein